MEDILTFVRLARHRSVASLFSDALFSKAVAIHSIRRVELLGLECSPAPVVL